MSAHVKAQLLRFVRTSGLAFVSAFLMTGGRWPGWAGLWALLAGAGETGLRELLPVKPIPSVSSVLAPPGPPVS